MNDERLPDAIIGRLSRVRTLESQLVDRLEEQEIRVAGSAISRHSHRALLS